MMNNTIEYILCDENKCIEAVERIIEEHSIAFLNKCIDNYQRKKADKMYKNLIKELDKDSLMYIKDKLEDYISDMF